MIIKCFKFWVYPPQNLWLKSIATGLFFLVCSFSAHSATLSGTLFKPGGTLASASVQLLNTLNSNVITQSISDDAGRFSIDAAPGTYNIFVRPPSSSGLPNTLITAVILSEFGTNQDILIVGTGKSLSGSITTHEGAAVVGASLMAYSDSGNPSSTVTTGANGVYSFSGLTPGTYRLIIRGIDSSVIPNLNGSWYTEMFVTNIDVTQDQVLNASLPEFFKINGIVSDSNSVPVAGIDITVSSSGYASLSGSFYSSQRTDNSGRFVTKGPATNYQVRVSPAIDSNFPVTSTSYNLDADATLRITLPFIDSKPPKFIVSPISKNIEQFRATVIWQTDEPSIGAVSIAGRSINEVAYVTQHSVNLTDLQASTTYTATVSATDPSGNGPTTATVSFTTASLPDTTPPVIISGPTVSSLTNTSAVIEWETNEPATTVISGGLSVTVAGYRSQHRVVLTDLTGLTAYTLNVNSTDVSGNGPVTRALTFTTLPALNSTPPVITKGPWALDIGATTATIVWETNEPSTSGVSYNDGTAYGVFNDSALARQHSVRLTGLTASTPYNTTVSSKNGLGHGPTLSSVFNFKTKDVADTASPEFESTPVVCNISAQTLQLCFKTDEPASVVVNYGLTSDSLTKSEVFPWLVQNHTLTLNGLTADTTYYLLSVIKDQAGNTSTSSLITATTASVASANPSFVSGPTVSYQGHDRVVIEWETSRPCNALVEYGEGNYGLQVSSGQFQSKHKIVIPNLLAGTRYQFQVKVTDIDGNSTVGGLVP